MINIKMLLIHNLDLVLENEMFCFFCLKNQQEIENIFG